MNNPFHTNRTIQSSDQTLTRPAITNLERRALRAELLGRRAVRVAAPTVGAARAGVALALAEVGLRAPVELGERADVADPRLDLGRGVVERRVVRRGVEPLIEERARGRVVARVAHGVQRGGAVERPVRGREREAPLEHALGELGVARALLDARGDRPARAVPV